MFYRYNGHSPYSAYRRASRQRWIFAFFAALYTLAIGGVVAYLASSIYGKIGAALLSLSILFLLFYPYPTRAARRAGIIVLFLQTLSLGAAYMGGYARITGHPIGFLSSTWLEIGPLITTLFGVIPLFLH